MDDSITESNIASGVLDSVVLFVFVFRMWIRIRMQRVGWEDIWATVAFVCGALTIVSDWVYLGNSGTGQSSITAMWIYMFTFTCLVWAVRISILFSIIRIIPAQDRLHVYGFRIIIVFLLTGSGIIVQKAVSCTEAYHTFHTTSSSPYFSCSFLRSLSISEMAVGAVGDTIVVVFPLYVLRGVTLPRKQLQLLRLLFLSNILVLIVCCLRIASQLVPALMHWSMFITNLRIATCLVVCNLLVVATYLYRMLKRQKHRTGNDTTEKDPTVDHNDLATPRQMTLTTIDILFSTQSEEGTEVATVA